MELTDPLIIWLFFGEFHELFPSGDEPVLLAEYTRIPPEQLEEDEGEPEELTDLIKLPQQLREVA